MDTLDRGVLVRDMLLGVSNNIHDYSSHGGLWDERPARMRWRIFDALNAWEEDEMTHDSDEQMNDRAAVEAGHADPAWYVSKWGNPPRLYTQRPSFWRPFLRGVRDAAIILAAIYLAQYLYAAFRG